MGLYRVFKRKDKSETVDYIETDTRLAALQELEENGYSRKEYNVETITED